MLMGIRHVVTSVSARVRTKSLQSCLTLCYLMDCSSPGSSVHGDSAGMNTEWVAMSTSRGSS